MNFDNFDHEFTTPWSLHFDRDGTEDFAIIRDANDCDLVTSKFFWLPDGENDPLPGMLAVVRVMRAAPQLLDVLAEALPILEAHATAIRLRSGGICRTDVHDKAVAAIRLATTGE